ncbi:MAG: hypothetical protein C4581_08510 [Nitrospiraceae bacterium]|nr:MAG: hypothetical protein C4581_08510 [Nitrospiraceae bacterium]
MTNEIDKELSQKYCPRFGQIAVEKGYVTSEQVKEAVSEQIDDNIAGRPHRLIGRIFLDNGIMTPQQIEIVLNELFKREKY